MFKNPVQILQASLSASIQPTQTEGDLIIFRVEDLPCRPSTAIKAIGYKASVHEFYIQWLNNNETRRYFHVPSEIWQQFRTCPRSLGQLYHEIIKGNYGSIRCENLIID